MQPKCNHNTTKIQVKYNKSTIKIQLKYNHNATKIHLEYNQNTTMYSEFLHIPSFNSLQTHKFIEVIFIKFRVVVTNKKFRTSELNFQNNRVPKCF